MVSLSISQDNKKNMIPLRRRRGSHLQCFHSHIKNTVARPDLARVSYRCSVLMAETHSDTAAGTPHERSPVFRTDPPPPPALSRCLSLTGVARAQRMSEIVHPCHTDFGCVPQGHCSESIVDRSVSSSPIHAHAHQTKEEKTSNRKNEPRRRMQRQGKGKKATHKEGKEKRGENNSRRTDWTLCRDVVHRPARSGFLLPTTTTTHTHTISGLSNSCAKAFLAHCAVGW